jgi:hypothetical protein
MSNIFFIMVTDSIVNVDVFSNITRGNRLSINDFDGSWGF